MWEAISSVFQMFVDLIPRPYRVDSTDEAVRITCGRWRGVLKPGTYFFWPLFQEIQTDNILERSSPTSHILAEDFNGNPYQARLVIRWRISDLEAFHFQSTCGQSWLEQEAQSRFIRALASCEDAPDAFEIAAAVLAQLVELGNPRGIAVFDVFPTIFASTRPYFRTIANETEIE